MVGVGPVAGFEQHGFKQADFDDFSANAVDFDPITDTDTVAPHEDEPSKEGDDEIFHRDGETGAGEAKHCSRLCGHAEDDEEDEECANGLGSKFHDGAESINALVFRRHAGEEMVDHSARDIDSEQYEKNP